MVYKVLTINPRHPRFSANGPELALQTGMLRKIARLFVIRTRWEAYLVIYAIAVGAITRGLHYLDQYPGLGGWLLFATCTGVVFVAGAKLLDATRPAAHRGASLRRVVARARAN